VRDEEVRETQIVLQIAERTHDLRLHRDVEPTDRLVENEQIRVECKRTRDADALTLPSGELLRGAIGVLVALAVDAVDREWYGGDLANGLTRVQ